MGGLSLSETIDAFPSRGVASGDETGESVAAGFDGVCKVDDGDGSLSNRDRAGWGPKGDTPDPTPPKTEPVVPPGAKGDVGFGELGANGEVVVACPDAPPKADGVVDANAPKPVPGDTDCVAAAAEPKADGVDDAKAPKPLVAGPPAFSDAPPICCAAAPENDVGAEANAPKPPLTVDVVDVGDSALPKVDCPNAGCPNEEVPNEACPNAEVGFAKADNV